jgi:hypothetical protein
MHALADPMFNHTAIIPALAVHGSEVINPALRHLPQVFTGLVGRMAERLHKALPSSLINAQLPSICSLNAEAQPTDWPPADVHARMRRLLELEASREKE